ncbi:anti-sigma factor antagonist [Cellulomonas bogoriensis 69B4 = DSM 16987]|uniref:Anti-sigma factor antagonist n=1 Tax=Cellulomonas bogoriensis 69B4 = DSM 16987 TaxID=1386082 RepID=A0A0A0BZ33_9CELL|nr:anti-sigma factor antagonist [Cellulomonas bogoriensis 69B4 = DSM 16987]
MHPDDQQTPGAVAVTHTDDGSVVTLRGEVDAALRDEAGLAMAAVIAHGGPVVVDMAEVTFIDSSGLAFVIQLHRLSQEDPTQTCVLRDPPDLVVELLEMVGLGGEIPLTFTPGDSDPREAAAHGLRPFTGSLVTGAIG